MLLLVLIYTLFRCPRVLWSLAAHEFLRDARPLLDHSVDRRRHRGESVVGEEVVGEMEEAQRPVAMSQRFGGNV